MSLAKRWWLGSRGFMSNDRDITGDQAEGGETASYEGYVYVATNPAMPNIVKIGSTTQRDPQSRITALFTTSVPLPFELKYAAAVTDDPIRVERALHEAFAPQRMHPRREFFEVEPNQVIAILRLLDVADVTEQAKSDVEAETSQEDREALKRVRRRPVLNFGELGLSEGSILTFEPDARVKAEVVDGRRVRLIELPEGEYPAVVVDDKPRYLSPLSGDLLGVAHNVPPTGYWRVEGGRSLLEVYNEKHGPTE